VYQVEGVGQSSSVSDLLRVDNCNTDRIKLLASLTLNCHFGRLAICFIDHLTSHFTRTCQLAQMEDSERSRARSEQAKRQSGM
jgi:hypothetical protein